MRRRLLPILFATLVTLVTAPPALGGGFATAGLSSTPDGLLAGQPWKVDITVLQHGRTPLDGLTPRVRISSGDTTHEVVAEPAGKAGVYHVEVVFPTAGRWNYEVLDGFIDDRPHKFPAVVIGEASGSRSAVVPDGDGGGIAAGWLWGAGAALLLALAVLGLSRRRRSPEPAV